MKVLFCTQTMDTEDTAMSFFHGWVKEFAPAYEKVTVFCLYKGVVVPLENVNIFSLGKEKYKNRRLQRLIYAMRLLYFSYRQKNEYDVVFVHMNQEYILVSGLLWKMLRKPICLWYNHYAGSFLTDVAVLLCDKVCYTSRFSYTAKYRKAVQMPVGVDTVKFTPISSVQREPRSFLFLGRIAPSKRLDMFINALVAVLKSGHECSGSVYGPAISEADHAYLRMCQQIVNGHAMTDKIYFHNGVSADKTPHLYASHSIFVNCSQSGMYDKTLFEAAASGCVVIAASEDFRKLAGDDHSFDIRHPDELIQRMCAFLDMSHEEAARVRIHMRQIAEMHSLRTLSQKIYFVLDSLWS